MSDQTHLVAGPLQIQRPIDTRGKQQQEQQLGQFPPPTSSSNLLALSLSLSLSFSLDSFPTLRLSFFTSSFFRSRLLGPEFSLSSFALLSPDCFLLLLATRQQVIYYTYI